MIFDSMFMVTERYIQKRGYYEKNDENICAGNRTFVSSRKRNRNVCKCSKHLLCRKICKIRRVVGSFEIDIPHFFNAYSGELVKIGKNKYRSQKKGLTITVYKKKLVMKVSGSRYDKALRGTYKLKKRYPRP